jgi:glucose/mannose-6-phosphate isomerase
VAREKSYPMAELPQVSQPRYAALYVVRAIVDILVSYSVSDQSQLREIESAADSLKSKLEIYAPDVPTDKNPAKRLALELMGSSPVIYASSLFYPVAYKWKISMNENAKNVAWAGEYPEFNHNEFLGWSSHPVDKPYKVVDLRSDLDHPQITKRFEVSDRLLSGRRPAAEVVQLEGATVLEQMLHGVAFGDFVSLYLALLNGLNPTPVDLIEKMKKELV